VSELVVVFAVCVFSLLLAGSQARGTSGSKTGDHDLVRMLAAVRRACSEFLWRETKLLGLLLALVASLLALPLRIFGGGSQGAGGSWYWAGAALFLGAAAGAGVAQLAQWGGTRATAQSLEAVRHDLHGATMTSLRGAAFIAILTDAASLLLTLGIFGAQYLQLTWLGQAEPSLAIFEASRSLPAATLGALAAAAVFQVGGSSFHTAAGLAGTSVRTRYAHVARDEEQNPALVAELVGDYVGGVVCRSTDAFSAFVLANSGLLVVAGLVARENPSLGVGALAALASLPLLIRASGLLATSISVASFRLDDQVAPTNVLAAAHASHALMLATGLFGATLWLLGDPLYLLFFGAGALGVLPGLLAAGLLFVRAERPDSPATALASAPRSAQSVARALGLGLQHTAPPLLIVGVCLGAACLLGARAPLEHGGVFALVIAVAAMLGAGALNLCQSLFATLTESLRRMTQLRRGRFDAAACDRALHVEQLGLRIGDMGHTQCILGGAVAALLGTVTLPLLQPQTKAAALGLGGTTGSLSHPIVILVGILGAGSLLFHIGGVLKSSSRTASSLDRDLQLRLEGDEEADASAAPSLPSYRVSVQLAMRGATQALVPLTLNALFTPFAVGVLLRVVYGPDSSGLIANGLMAFGSVAALTGCFAALAAQGTLLALGTVRHGADTLGAHAAGASAAFKFMGRCVGPAALLGLKATVVSSLAIAPLLF
jgi:K(+)-stimulated pyrophosphate-energized sodium pump